MQVQPLEAITGVLFDLDGTLVDTFPYYRDAIARCLLAPDAQGRRRPILAARALWAFGRYRNELRRRGELDADLHEHQFTAVARRLGTTSQEIKRLIVPLCYDGPFDGLRAGVRPGVRPLVLAIKAAGLKVGILSDFPVEAKLRAMALADLPWDVLTDSEAAGALKPHTAPYHAALAGLGCAASQTVYVGDRRDTDVAGARRVGMPTVLLGRSLFKPGPAPDRRIDRLVDLAPLLGLLTVPATGVG